MNLKTQGKMKNVYSRGNRSVRLWSLQLQPCVAQPLLVSDAHGLDVSRPELRIVKDSCLSIVGHGFAHGFLWYQGDIDVNDPSKAALAGWRVC